MQHSGGGSIEITEATKIRFCTCGNGGGFWKQLGFNDNHIINLHILCGGIKIQNSSHHESIQDKTISQQNEYIKLLEKRLVLMSSPWYKRLFRG
jgi:hypothetical protein